MHNYFFSLALLVSLIYPGWAYAAELSIISQEATVGVGDTLHVSIVLSSKEESLNALEGRITFPEDLLQLSTIEDGNSVILFWAERAKISGNEVMFSGIMPGGYKETGGNVLQLVFKVIAEGDVRIGAKNIRALQNDGQGTEAQLAFSPLIISTQATSTEATASSANDNEPPELFIPEVTKDQNIFDGKWFLVFATQDKGSGIDRYLVCEDARCETAESPFLLNDQTLKSKITVTAIDRVGSVRVAEIQPTNNSSWLVVLIPAILVLLACIIALVRRHKKLH